MASEITRIASATQFNGIYLLNGNLSSSTSSTTGLTASGKLKIHFGITNSSAEDYYYVQIGSCTASSLGVGLAAGSSATGASISTQSLAEGALAAINNAITSKDKIRADLGALENRLADTVQNLTIQGQNEQAAQSQIADVNVATEMTNFVRSQILVQSSVAMLSQANSMPKMALQLLQG
jgi:flagellin